MFKCHVASLLLAAMLLGHQALAQSTAPDASAKPRKALPTGGLCLVVGVKDTALAQQLAKTSELYVQVLQPDGNLAAKWGAAFAKSDAQDREKLGVRNASFDPRHYSANLFNLIVVDDPAALGQAVLADLCRILAPEGVVAFQAVPAGMAAHAKELGMSPLDADAVAPLTAGYRKPIRPVEWRLPLETKWRAGPRSQIANGYNGVCTGDGKLFYIEQMERNEGDLRDSAAVLFARDAYNGRTLWTWELPGRYGQHAGVGLVCTNKGRLFAKTGTGQLLCLDGNTGKTLFEVASKVSREARIWLLNDDLLSIHGDVRSTETGKPAWKYPILAYQPLPGTIVGEVICFCDGKSIFARKLADGNEVWRTPATDLPKAISPGSLSRADRHLLVRMAGSKDEATFALLDGTTGKLMWTHTMKVRISKSEQYFNAGQVRSTTVDGKLLLYYRHNQPNVYLDEVVATKLDLATGKPEYEDKINPDAGDYHGCFGELQLGDYIAYYDIWVNKKTLETTRGNVPHPACFFGMNAAFGTIYNFPSRKSGPISAVGPADLGAPVAMATAAAATRRMFRTAGPAPASRPDDWPMFRGRPAGGNATAAEIGKDLVKAWEVQVGLPGRHFGIMSSQRTGLSQAVLADGRAIVSDIDGQRIVALDTADGKERWVFHVGSRVDFPPTLHGGLCLFSARDGFVYCLDAATGQLVYKLLAAPGEHYIGGGEKLESRWPLESDVLVANDVAYVAGSGGGIAFKPETGESVEAKEAAAIALGGKPIAGGRDLRMSYDVVLKGNSIPRTNEDNWKGFTRGRFGNRLDARVLAFDETLTVAYQFRPAGEGWANKGTLTLKGITTDPAKPAWTSEPIELVVDDILLTPQHVYCVGHYQRVKKSPELWVLSRQDGKVVNTVAIEGFPAFLGMSATEGRLFVATRDGKLICYRRER